MRRTRGRGWLARVSTLRLSTCAATSSSAQHSKAKPPDSASGRSIGRTAAVSRHTV